MDTSRRPILMLAALVTLCVLAAVIMPRLVESGEPTSTPAATSTRLVSLTPAVTNILVALGVEDRLVGRSDFCSAPMLADIPTAGTGIQPNFEALVGLRPDLILAASTAALEVETLGKIAPVEPLRWSSVEDLTTSIARLGQLTASEEEASTLIKRFESAFTGVVNADGPRILMVMDFGAQNEGQLWFIKPNSLHGQAIIAAGGRHAVEGPVSGSPTLSLESLIELDPDIIISMVARDDLSDAERATRRASMLAVKPLKAAKNGQVYILDGKWVFGEGPSLLRLVERLSEVIAIAEGIGD